MITIYANWTGTALAQGATLDDARKRLTFLDCDRATIFGHGPADVTAIDTGPHWAMSTTDEFHALQVARRNCPLVSAEGPARFPSKGATP